MSCLAIQKNVFVCVITDCSIHVLASLIGHTLTRDCCSQEGKEDFLYTEALTYMMHTHTHTQTCCICPQRVSILYNDMMTYDSAIPMRKVLSFLMGSHKKSLTHYLGSDRERKGKLRRKK